MPLSLRLMVLAAALLMLACPVTSEPPVQHPPQPPPPGALEAGLGHTRMPVPLGVGTAGYNGIGVSSAGSPYARRFPATMRIHGHPDIRAVALSRGEGHELIFVRVDLIAVVRQLREGVLRELEERRGRRFDDALIIGATHTHAGPGRFVQDDVYSLITDVFFPQLHDRLVAAITDTVEQALDDLQPASIAWTEARPTEAQNDRRCNDLVERGNDEMPLLVVRRGEQIDALLASFAMHGTILGIDDLTLSQDASGAVEEQLEELFDHDVSVLLFNSWAADMAPGSPEGDPSFSPSEMLGGYDHMDRLGGYVAERVGPALAALQPDDFSSEPALWTRTIRYPISRELLGYEDDIFPYEWGAVYCSSSESSCEDLLYLEDLHQSCVPFPETSPAPLQTLATVGQLGSRSFTTFPAECSTELAEQLLGDMQAAGAGDTWFLGYSNDYLGYAITEEDWWRGGYEASGHMWGPRQGDYMAEQTGAAFASLLAGDDLAWDQPVPSPAYETDGDTTLDHEQAEEVGTVTVQPSESLAVDGVASFEVLGSDPWLGAPIAALQQESSSGYEDVLRANGQALDSDGYAFWVELHPTPGYDEESEAISRRFGWRFELPLKRRVGPLAEVAGGTYRFRVTIPVEGGDPMEVTTNPFSIEE